MNEHEIIIECFLFFWWNERRCCMDEIITEKIGDRVSQTAATHKKLE